MTAFRYDEKTGLQVYPSQKAATAAGNSPFFKSAEELVKCEDFSTGDLAKIHNGIRADKPVNRFSDRAAAERRTLEALNEFVANLKLPAEEESKAAATNTDKQEGEGAKPPKSNKTMKGEGSGRRGRTTGQNAWVGKTLHPLVKENTRRAGSHGYKSLQIVIDNPGITTEEFIKKGGRSVDLRWDVNKKAVAARAAEKKE